LVKNFINTGSMEGQEDKDVYGYTMKLFEAINKKPIMASEDEIRNNSRARSARLRIAEKI